jgi:hypothetical protein
MSNRSRMRGKGRVLVWGPVLCLLIVLGILIFLCCNFFFGREGVPEGVRLKFMVPIVLQGKVPVRWVFLVEVNFLAKVYLSKVFW